MTGTDEVLVFDYPDDPEYHAILPGGGIEAGETVEETARREVLEETGLAVRVIREVGVFDDSHFVQAAPLAPTADEWEHRKLPGEELVRCRWVELRPGLDLWGERGALIEALMRRRVVAYVTRVRNGVTELLTIEHRDYPEAELQVPAGRLEHGESLEEGLLRELAEETGLERARIVGELPDFEATYENFCENHAFHVVPEAETPDVWEHQVHGDGADSGLVHLCRWVLLKPDLPLWFEGDPMLAKLPIKGA